MKTGLIQVVALSEQLFLSSFLLGTRVQDKFILNTAFTTEHVFLPFMFLGAAAKNATQR